MIIVHLHYLTQDKTLLIQKEIHVSIKSKNTSENK